MSFSKFAPRVRQIDVAGTYSQQATPKALRINSLPPISMAQPATPFVSFAPQPKPEARRNARLLDMARGKACLLRVPAVCNGNPETTVACHSNLGIHGKSGARKADDCYSVWGCAACHEYLDRSPAAKKVKERFFMEAHNRQVFAWRLIASSAAAPEPDRRAAEWALRNLNAAPSAEGLE